MQTGFVNASVLCLSRTGNQVSLAHDRKYLPGHRDLSVNQSLWKKKKKIRRRKAQKEGNERDRRRHVIRQVAERLRPWGKRYPRSSKMEQGVVGTDDGDLSSPC